MKWVLVVSGLIGLMAIVLLVTHRPQRPEPAPALETFEIKFIASETLSVFSETDLTNHRKSGDSLFNRYQCIGCHADEGRALKKFEALGNKYNIESLADYLKRPNPPMPIFPLGDEQRRDLAVYLIERYPGLNGLKSAQE